VAGVLNGRGAAPSRLVSLLGLGFGDCGKGLFTDFLCRRWQAGAVVRFNGGAQAGHNVVLPDGRHHTFSQFCAGTLVPGVLSVLASPVVVHPTALLVEHAALQALGIPDALARLRIDARCRINTPFHQAAGRLRELRRGAASHGTCGVGVGETVRHALAHPGEVLCYGDLLAPARAHDKLEAIRRRLLAGFDAPAGPATQPAAWQQEQGLLRDASVSARWLASVAELARQCKPAQSPEIARELQGCGTVLFEGAQGVLLDEWHGFHPHTTWSSIHPASVESVTADLGLTGPIMHLGILRSYLTRHGNGPLPTFDAALDVLAEPHNTGDGWQGRFRRGHADAVLLRYALEITGKLDGLLLSHLDVFDAGLPGGGVNLCTAYEAAPEAGDALLCQRIAHGEGRERGSGLVERLLPGNGHDLQHQSRLTALLARAQPVYEGPPLRSASALVERFQALAACPVLYGGYGPSFSAVRAITGA
jgi:adenylosuccinate synthase